MASLAMEKSVILSYVAAALGEEGLHDVPLGISFPPLESDLPPAVLGVVESVEVHLGIPCDRVKLTKVKPVKVDLYLPGRDVYIELDRTEHDVHPARETTLSYYPPGLPRGFDPHRYRVPAAVGAAFRSEGATPKMNAGRALNDFVKDIYVEHLLGKVLVRLQKAELVWLLAKTPEAEKCERLKRYLADLSVALALPQINPER